MDRSPHPRSYLTPRWIGGGLVAAAIFAGGVREAIQTDGQGAEPVVAAATDTVPETEAPNVPTTPETAVITVPASTEAPTPVTTTLPDRVNIDATTTTSTSTSTTTTTSSAPPAPPTTIAPETTTIPPETTPPTTEVDPVFELPPYQQAPAEVSEQLHQDSFYISFGDKACSGSLLRVGEQIVGGPLAAHCLPETIIDVDGQPVMQHYGSIKLEQGERVGDMKPVATVGGFLIPEGGDMALAVVEGVDPQVVREAYAAQLATERPTQGDMAWTVGYPGEQATDGILRQQHNLIFIGHTEDFVVEGRRTGPMDIWVAGPSDDGSLIRGGSSGTQLRGPDNKNLGTISSGEPIVRREGIFGTAELMEGKFNVNLNRPDIATIVFVQPPEVPSLSYVTVENTNRAEIYATEIAAIKAEAHEALLDTERFKAYTNATVHLNSDYFIGTTTATMIENALFHTDEAGNTLVYGRDPADRDLGMGMMMFIPAGEEAHLEIKAGEGLTQDSLLGQTYGEVQPIASQPDYPDFLDAFGYVDESGTSHLIGRGLLEAPPTATASYEIIVRDGQITLVTVATDAPPVPPTSTPTPP